MCGSSDRSPRRCCALPSADWLIAEESLAPLAAVLIVGLGSERVTILSPTVRPSYLKLDRSLISAIDTDPDDPGQSRLGQQADQALEADLLLEHESNQQQGLVVHHPERSLEPRGLIVVLGVG